MKTAMKIDLAKELLQVKYGILVGIGGLVIALDQWTKSLIHAKFQWGESITLLDSIFALTYVRNMGAAFGMLNRAPSYFRDPFFIIVPLLAMVIILFVFARLSKDQNLTAVALTLVFGGAVGNLIDRLRFGYVIDFLDFHWKEVYHWPAFNVADSCIVVGVSVLFLLSFQPVPEPAKRKKKLKSH